MGVPYNCFWCERKLIVDKQWKAVAKAFPRSAKHTSRYNPSIEAWSWDSWAVHSVQEKFRRAVLVYMPYRQYTSERYAEKRFVTGNTKRIRMCPEHFEEFQTITHNMVNQWGWEYLIWVE